MSPNSGSFSSAARWFALLSCALAAWGQDVGSGAPTQDLTRRFINSYFRNGFYNLVSLPPVNNVQRFGANGLIQEFRDAARTANVKLALIKANANTPETAGSVDILQVYADIYGYYSTIGVNTAGFPTNDTQQCPIFEGNACSHQSFDKNYTLFVYKTATVNGQNFAIRDPFYTRWVAAGSLNGLGRPADIERSVTSAVSQVTATRQLYSAGAIFDVTSGTFDGRTFVVLEPLNTFYQGKLGHDGVLGLPVADEVTLSGTTRRRQVFEGGSIEYDPAGGGDPILKLPVASVSIVVPTTVPVRLTLGDTIDLRAVVLGAGSSQLTDRPVSWSTTNGRVVSISANGLVATVRAIGGGSATVIAASEGKTSPPVSINVVSPCCQVGEGAPNLVTQQSFQDAVARNRLALALPAPNPVRRVGGGYVQEVFSASTPSTRYLLAKPDSQPVTYFAFGNLLSRYEQLGGPGGSLGYPVSDPSPGGRQLFESRVALAGSPLRAVSGYILTRWAQLNYETGPAGPPTGDFRSGVSAWAVISHVQEFRDGWLLAAASGVRSGLAYFVSGLILRRYVELSGPEGRLGLPVADEVVIGGRRRQNFEGGWVEYAPGDASAVETLDERRPVLTAFPESVLAGSRVRLTFAGFQPGASVRISVTGQPDFRVTAPDGVYTWESYVPPTASNAVVNVRAADTGRSDLAVTSYTVRSLAEAGVQVVKLEGDGQTGPPGAQLPIRLRVAVRQASGNPVIGAAVQFTPSPGGQVVSSTSVTDNAGVAEATVRLPNREGLALVTAESARVVATFSLRATELDLANVPRFPQVSTEPLGSGTATIAQKGALLSSAASILRYYQNRGDLPSPIGSIEPVMLNRYLRDLCLTDADGRALCDGYLAETADRVVNPWRLAGAVGGQLDVFAISPDTRTVIDQIARGYPVLLGLSLTADGVPAGGHYVVASGVAASGSIRIVDPSPVTARTLLDEFTATFGAAGRLWSGRLVAAVVLVPRSPSPSGFVVSAVSRAADRLPEFSIVSAAGECGLTVDLPDAAVLTPNPASSTATLTVSRLRYCEGAALTYVFSGSGGAVALTDLSAQGRRFEVRDPSTALAVARTGNGPLTLGPVATTFLANAVVNAATFTAGISPGGLFAVFGSGLASGSDTRVELGGTPARVIFRSPFQVNAEVPPALTPGTHSLRVVSAFGAADAQVDVQALAPVIFPIGDPATGVGAVTDENGALNSLTSPVSRGRPLIIYCTGLGSVAPTGAYSVAREPVEVSIADRTLAPAFAGLTPGFVGLYQVNVVIPADFPPGLDLPLQLKQGGFESNAVRVAIR